MDILDIPVSEQHLFQTFPADSIFPVMQKNLHHIRKLRLAYLISQYRFPGINHGKTAKHLYV